MDFFLECVSIHPRPQSNKLAVTTGSIHCIWPTAGVCYLQLVCFVSQVQTFCLSDSMVKVWESCKGTGGCNTRSK